MSSRVRTISATTLAKIIAIEPLPLLIDFTATWCHPCRELAPKLAGFADAEQHRVRVVSVDVDACPQLAEVYEVSAMPTLMLFRRGTVLAVLCGVPDPLEQVTALLDALGDLPPLSSVPELNLGVRAVQERWPRQLRFTGPLPGTMDITTQPGWTGEKVIATSAEHTASLTLVRGDDLDLLGALDADALETLYIRRRQGDDRSLTNLLHLTGLKHLHYWTDRLTPADRMLLGQLTHLHTLDIPHSALSGTDVQALRDALAGTVINCSWISPALRHRLRADDRSMSVPVVAELSARRYGPEHTTAYLTLRIDDTCHVYSASVEEDIPVAITLPADSPWQLSTTPVFPATDDGVLTGTTLIAIDLAGSAPYLELHVQFQAWDDSDGTCLPITDLLVTCTVQDH
ncbi:thioredoxin family protein [Streptomyces phaeochromogenes]|uniref:thioredoxin family protein n=1 Tax=Streptomyces phaeochromogenes TaxID=1923 RepID=UPI00225AE7CC|nr:thioredoxin family protein [Streptomyces phaeochromogenes]MCX5601194.1 thioredoxin family protein [Streptomyces phaeochromogenes]